MGAQSLLQKGPKSQPEIHLISFATLYNSNICLNHFTKKK